MLGVSCRANPLEPTDTLEFNMVVPLDTDPLPNQLGDHRVVFNEPALNSSSSTMVVGAFRLAGALGSAPFVVVAGGVVVVVVTGGVATVVGVVGALGPVHTIATVGHRQRHNRCAVFKQRFVTYKFVAVLLQNGAGKGLSAHYKHGFAVFFQFIN